MIKQKLDSLITGEKNRLVFGWDFVRSYTFIVTQKRKSKKFGKNLLLLIHTMPLDFLILDTQGKLISQSKISVGENISVSELDAGVYFYRVVIGEEISAGKFVKI